MKAEIKAWLADIKQAITEIHLFLPDKTDFNTFQRDLKYISTRLKNKTSNREEY